MHSTLILHPDSTLRRLLRYLLFFFLVVVACCGALLLAGLLPQDAVSVHLKESAALFEAEGCYPQISQSSDVYMLDNFSDALIVSHSYYMDTRESPASVFSNPRYKNGDPVSSLLEVAQAEPAANWNYSHYWMGFRLPVRALLTFMDYSNIRIVVTWVFLLLFCAAMLTLARRVDFWAALCFAIAVISCNLIVMSVSLQFSCCYILAFSGILAVDRFHKRESDVAVIFLLLGQLTQYFDFYTTPIITYGLPMAALILMEQKAGRLSRAQDSFRIAAKGFLAWALAYAGMWVVRMVLVTAFTPINGFQIFESFADYTGIINASHWIATAKTALMKAYWRFASIPAFAVCGVSIFVWILLLMKNRKALCLGNFLSGAVFLVLAMLPIVWICASAKAFVAHCWFQYRSLSLFVFGAYCFLFRSIQAAGPAGRRFRSLSPSARPSGETPSDS